MRIIGLTGLARSGKDTVARLIHDQLTRADPAFNCAIMAFADPLKRFCREVFDFSPDQLYGDHRELPDPRWTRPDGTPLTARFALQTLGTEWGRNCDPDVWVKAGLRRASQSLAEVVIFTDVRFINEAAALRRVGGQLWRVDRGTPRAHAHESEAHVWGEEMNLHVTHSINNTGSLMRLAVEVHCALRLPPAQSI